MSIWLPKKNVLFYDFVCYFWFILPEKLIFSFQFDKTFTLSEPKVNNKRKNILNLIFKLNSNFPRLKKVIVCASLNEKSSVIAWMRESRGRNVAFEFVATKLHFEWIHHTLAIIYQLDVPLSPFLCIKNAKKFPHHLTQPYADHQFGSHKLHRILSLFKSFYLILKANIQKQSSVAGTQHSKHDLAFLIRNERKKKKNKSRRPAKIIDWAISIRHSEQYEYLSAFVLEVIICVVSRYQKMKSYFFASQDEAGQVKVNLMPYYFAWSQRNVCDFFSV